MSKDKASIAIMRFDPAILEGKQGIQPMRPFPMRTDPPGGVPHGEYIFWNGETVVLVYESKEDLTLYLDDPYPFDQFVYVLFGRTILTDRAGHSEEFGVGDSFMLPKGFKGDWQLLDGYRELCVMEGKAYRSSDELGGDGTN